MDEFNFRYIVFGIGIGIGFLAIIYLMYQLFKSVQADKD